ncbi:MAG: cytochrome c family protein [Xanthobacteraceae bacterium]|nr:cytochrome c family protein [Xanthobacteraceae bacterium]
MKKTGLVYAALISVAVAAAVTIIFSLYRSGSTSIPAWPNAFKPGALSAQHAFLGDRCDTCHTPIRGVEAATCIGCHATAAANLDKQSTAFHATLQDCRGCHIEHQGGNRPTKMDHAALLRIGTHLTAVGARHTSVSRQMVEDMTAFLGMRMSRQAEKNNLKCASCHSTRDPHRELFGRDCAGCHETTTWRITGFLHPSPTSRDCAQCHQAPPSHYMMHFEMVSKSVARQHHADVRQCYLCHQTSSFNEIKGAGWYKHH